MFVRSSVGDGDSDVRCGIRLIRILEQAQLLMRLLRLSLLLRYPLRNGVYRSGVSLSSTG